MNEWGSLCHTLIDYLSWRDNIMSRKIRTEAVDSLFDAVLSLKSREECYTFFEDVCTINELLSLSQRFEVAKMLRDQKTYLEIAEKTGASTATISRVNRSMVMMDTIWYLRDFRQGLKNPNLNFTDTGRSW